MQMMKYDKTIDTYGNDEDLVIMIETYLRIDARKNGKDEKP